MLLIISLSIQVVLLLCSSAQAAPVKLNALCNGDNVELRTVQDIETLLEQLGDANSGCQPRALQAIRDMAEIAKDKQACRMDKAEAITKFVDDYLKQAPEEIPRPLADFAIAYGMQVSGLCSQEMVETFTEQADARLYDKLGPDNYPKFLALKRYLGEESPMSVVLAPILNTGELVLPVDLMQLVPEVGDDKLDILVPRNERLSDMQYTCENLLRPLYEPTLLPLAHLNRAGFNNVAFYWRKVHKEGGRFWSVAVYLCEALRTIQFKGGELEPVEPDDEVSCERGDSSQSLTEKLDRAESDSCVRSVEQTPIEEYRSELLVGDEIVSNSVRKLVRNYNINKSEVERLRERIQNRSFNLMVAMIRRGQNKGAAIEALKMIEVRSGAEAEDFERTRTAIVELANSAEPQLCPSGALRKLDDEALSLHERKGMGFWGRFFLSMIVAILIGIIYGLCGGPPGYYPYRPPPFLYW